MFQYRAKLLILIVILNWIFPVTTAERKSVVLPKPSSISQISFPQKPDVPTLHRLIIAAYDAHKYIEASQLLQYFESNYPDQYSALPYELLRAHTLMLAGQQSDALALYRKLSKETDTKAFVYLPMARLSAATGDIETAVE